MTIDHYERQLAHLHATDFGPEIVPGSRVMHTQSGRRGMVVQIVVREVEPRTYYDDLWRPRLAGVEWDGHRNNPNTGRYQLSWMGPEDIAAIPQHWGLGVGILGGTTPPRFKRVSRTIVRIEVDEFGCYEFVLLKDPSRYPGICRRYKDWRALEAEWHVIRRDPGADGHGPFIWVDLGGRRE